VYKTNKQLVRSIDSTVKVPYVPKAPMPTDMWGVFKDSDFAWNRHHSAQFRKDWGKQWGREGSTAGTTMSSTTSASTSTDAEVEGESEEDEVVRPRKRTKVTRIESDEEEM
jgi:hypothetical protein